VSLHCVVRLHGVLCSWLLVMPVLAKESALQLQYLNLRHHYMLPAVRPDTM
jgi:hypothetical protein